MVCTTRRSVRPARSEAHFARCLPRDMLAKSDATGRVMSTFWQDKIKFAEPEKDCDTVSERQGLKAMKDVGAVVSI